MDFDFSDEQKLFQTQVRRALEQACPLAEVRRGLDGGEPFSPAAWTALIGLGVTAAAVPEVYGGLGLGYYELCLAAKEAGRALAPAPLLGSTYLATEALLLFGDEAQKRRWVPALAAGQAVLGFADAGQAETPEFLDGRVHGRVAPAWDAGRAQAIVVKVSHEGRRALALVETGPATVVRPRRSLDPTRDVAEVVFTGAPGELLGASSGPAQLDRLYDRAAPLLAFEQLGGAQRALDMARDYAVQRRAFGRPIGSYQAIKHKLANIYIKVEIARAHALYAAWALSNDTPDLPLAAACALVTATEAFTLASQENIQTHGGMGFTWESDCQLFYRRARLTALQLGSQLNWKSRITDQLELRSAA